MPEYKFKLGPEFLFALLTGAVVFTFQMFTDFEPETITQWDTWIITAAGGLARAVAAAGLSYMTRKVIT